MGPDVPSDPSPWTRAAAALRSIQAEIRWKPDKNSQHLAKRKARSHLPRTASLRTYNDLIRSLVRGPGAVYLYRFGSVDYFAVRAIARGRDWLVIFDADGIIETAFPPDEIEEYLARRAFRYLNTVEEISSL